MARVVHAVRMSRITDAVRMSRIIDTVRVGGQLRRCQRNSRFTSTLAERPSRANANGCAFNVVRKVEGGSAVSGAVDGPEGGEQHAVSDARDRLTFALQPAFLEGRAGGEPQIARLRACLRHR